MPAAIRYDHNNNNYLITLSTTVNNNDPHYSPDALE